jgi:hypothetical protein
MECLGNLYTDIQFLEKTHEGNVNSIDKYKIEYFSYSVRREF